MGSFVEKFLRFTSKPRDGSAAGHPLTENSQLILLWRNRTTQSTGVRVIAKVYMPWNDTTETRVAIGPVSSSGTGFAGETAQISALGTFSNGELLVGAAITADSITDPTQLWGSVILREKTNNAISVPLCQGYTHGSNIVGWVAGTPTGRQSTALADAGTQGALFTFQGTVANGAGGAGDQTLTVVAPSGGRCHLLMAAITNQDTVARAASMTVTDGTNLLYVLGFNTALAAGNRIDAPSTGTTDAVVFAANGAVTPVWIAGAMQIILKNAAVAASQDTAFAIVLEVYGGAPTLTLAGASTPVLTTNTSAFMAG